jgi:hypothetical protein
MIIGALLLEEAVEEHERRDHHDDAGAEDHDEGLEDGRG